MKNKLNLKISGNALVLIVALIIVVVLFSVVNKNFFTYTNMINVLVASTLIGLTAIGITFLMMIGGTDLSAGAVAAFAGVFVAIGLNMGYNWVLLTLIALALAATMGLINGLLVTKLKLVPFIATLVSQSIWKGFAYLMCDGKPVTVNDKGFTTFCKMRVGGANGIPLSVIITIICFAIFAYILAKTRFGRKIFAIGGNPEAARLAGIDSQKVTLLCYIMTSVFAAFAGVILAGRMNSGNPNSNANIHFDAITAANLGGVSMVGGVGSIPTVALGVILVQAFNSGLNMAAVSPYWQYVARGMLLLGSLTIDFFRQRNREKRLLEDSMKNL